MNEPFTSTIDTITIALLVDHLRKSKVTVINSTLWGRSDFSEFISQIFENRPISALSVDLYYEAGTNYPPHFYVADPQTAMKILALQAFMGDMFPVTTSLSEYNGKLFSELKTSLKRRPHFIDGNKYVDFWDYDMPIYVTRKTVLRVEKTPKKTLFHADLPIYFDKELLINTNK